MNDEVKYAWAATMSGILVCAVGYLGNFITILAFIRCPKLMAQAATAFVLSLCISDFIFCSVSLPIITYRYLYENGILRALCCKLFPILFYGNIALSWLNMVAIAVNRYAFIAYFPYYNILYSNVSIFLQLVVIWSTSFLIAIPPLVEIWGEVGLDKSTFSCMILKGLDEESLKNFISLAGFVFPCIVIVVFYICIYLKVGNSSRNMLRDQVNGSRSKNTTEEGEDGLLTELMLLIFVCFVLCFLPLMAVNLFDKKVQFPTLHVLSSILARASSVINPFIYAAFNRQYRSAYMELFHVFRTGITTTYSKQLPNTNTVGTDNKHNHQSVVKVAANEQNQPHSDF